MDNQNQIDQQIQASFQKATAQRKKLERNTTRYAITGIILSALATFVAGVPSLMGEPIIADSWRITCTVAAIITLATTIVTSVQTQVAKPDTLARSSECVGRLRALLLDLQAQDVDYDQVRKQYQAVMIDFAEVEL
jgi:uncharacterized membrane protein (DUF485 family)